MNLLGDQRMPLNFVKSQEEKKIRINIVVSKKNKYESIERERERERENHLGEPFSKIRCSKRSGLLVAAMHPIMADME